LQLQGALFDRRCNDLEAAAFRAVGLRHYELYMESSVNEPLKRRHGEERRAAKNDGEGGGHRVIG
jgi:hypothetical protein